MRRVVGSVVRHWRGLVMATTVLGVGTLVVGIRVAAQGGGRLLLVLGALLLFTGLTGEHLGHGKEPERGGLVAGIVLLGLAGVLVWLGAFVDGYRFAAIVVTVVAFGHLLTEWRLWTWFVFWRGLAVLTLCGTAFLAGLALLRRDPTYLAVGLTFAGLFAAPIGVSLLTEDVLGRYAPDTGNPWWRRAPWHLAIVGGVLVVVSSVALLAGGAAPGFLVLAFLAAAVLVYLIAASAQADIAVVVLVLVALGSVVQEPAPLDDVYAADPGERVIVALGDSYMSGEGAQRYFKGTNDKDSNECRRAPTAYAPTLLADGSVNGATDLAFLACSGARATNLWEEAQGTDSTTARNVADGADAQRLTQLANLLRLRALGRVDVALLLVSIGGNDAEFSTIGLACVAPDDCVVHRDQWIRRLRVVDGRLRAAYHEIAALVAGEFPVVVVPYPVPLRREGCPATWLTDREHEFLHDFTMRLNAVIETAARDYGFAYVETMPTALGGGADGTRLRLCDDPDLNKVGVNFVGLRTLRSVNGPVEHRVNPANWMHNTFHPNEAGHAAMRRVLRNWLDTNRDLEPAPKLPAGEQRPPVPAEPRQCAVGEIDDEGCVTDTRNWALRQTADLVLGNLVALLTGLAGLWLLSVTGLVAWRSRERWLHKRLRSLLGRAPA